MSAPTNPLDGAAPPPASNVFDDQMRGRLAVIIVVGFFGFIGLAFFFPPQLPGDTLGVILGYLAGWVSAIVFFYWGSSSGSKMKSMQLSGRSAQQGGFK